MLGFDVELLFHQRSILAKKMKKKGEQIQKNGKNPKCVTTFQAFVNVRRALVFKFV